MGFPVHRSRFNARVNCWFCNADARVPFLERNSWTCAQCEQYNGFTKDGDYNRDMTAQRDCSTHSSQRGSLGSSICANSYYADLLATSPSTTQANGLCDPCNEAQRMKVEKLSQFEPKIESRFDRELKVYREQLEQQYRLCSSCERHVSKVLLEKKKMVLSSKFLNFIIKGAALLKQPHFNRLANAQRQRKLQRIRRLMTILTVVNIVCLLCRLPHATSQQFTFVLGDFLGSSLFYAYSHVLTLIRVLTSGVGIILELRESSAKVLLYARTFGKLLLYSMGLSKQQVQQATFASCFIALYPFAMLALSFLHKINDALRITRFTIMLLLWSAYAMGTDFLAPHIDGVTFIVSTSLRSTTMPSNSNIQQLHFQLLGSVITLVLLATNRSNLLSQTEQDESAGESFHRLCADECISDEETLSMLSQQLSGCSNTSATINSNLSMPSASVCLSRAPSISHRSSHRVPDSLLSLDSLHLSKQRIDHQNGWPSTFDAATPAMMLQQQQQHKPEMYLKSPGFRPASNNLTSSQTFARSSHNLLMPSRFPTMNRNLGGDVSAWVADTNQTINPDFGRATWKRYHEEKHQQLSRTSSQSSGFESQPRMDAQSQWGSAPLPMSDYGWANADNRGSQRNLLVGPPLASPTPTLASEYQFGNNFMGTTRQKPQQPAVQPGDLLRKWIESSAKAQQPVQ
ncbi:hypothetical protein KR009_000056 [Drosophila setifemur]|nr:hypothetical protein KR009_000056 [Drosophila setifemur]